VIQKLSSTLSSLILSYSSAGTDIRALSRPSTINSRYQQILSTSLLSLNSTHTIPYSHEKDMLWTMNPLPTHPNGMKFTVFDKEGDMLATNTYFSVGGGFVVNERTQGMLLFLDS